MNKQEILRERKNCSFRIRQIISEVMANKDLDGRGHDLDELVKLSERERELDEQLKAMRIEKIKRTVKSLLSKIKKAIGL